jgi:hypothetical protein
MPLPPEPNGWNKSMGAHERIPPDLANSRHTCTVSRWSLPELPTSARTRRTGIKKSLHLCTRETLCQPPLLDRSPCHRPPVDLIGKTRSSPTIDAEISSCRSAAARSWPCRTPYPQGKSACAKAMPSRTVWSWCLVVFNLESCLS